MIHQIEGALIEKDTDLCVIDAGGVGYGVFIPLSTRTRLPDEGERVRLFTYLYAREDQLTLYGFFTREERSAFLTMLGASRVGAKLALSILSAISIGDWARAVAGGDIATLSSVPGVGKRTAERMVVDLKTRITPFLTADTSEPGAAMVASDSAIQSEAVAALVALGATQTEAAERVGRAAAEVGEEANIETLIGAAMRQGRRR